MRETRRYEIGPTGSISAEQSVIGALLIDPDGAGAALFSELTPEDFSNATARHIFAAARGLWLENKKIDPVTVLAAAGKEYADLLAELMRNTPTAANCLEYAKIVRQETRLARVRSACLGAATTGKTPEEIRAAVEEAAKLLAENRRGRRVTMADAVMEFFDRLNRQGKERTAFLEWGIPYMTESLDTELGDFVVLGGYPSAGKTLLALQCARKIAETYRVGFFSLETGEKKLTNRLMSAASGVPLWNIKHNVLSESQKKMLAAAGEKLYMLPITIEEAAGDTVADIRARTLAGKYQVIFVDYLQLVNEPGSSRYEVVTEISRKLHTLAQELGVLVVALAQLTRPEKSGKDGKPIMPGMSSIRESGQVEQDADAILLLFKENQTKKDAPRLLRIAKNKEGEATEPCKLKLHGAVQLFEELFPEDPRAARVEKWLGKQPENGEKQEELPR